jgi:acyl-CoA synthetase (NDP forming)
VTLSLEPLLAPKSIAIIGASDNPKRIGGIPLELLMRAGFSTVWPVNPRYEQIQGLKGYPDIESVPGAPDLAILAVSAEETLTQLERCHARGVRAAIVFASGYAEEGTPEGERRQAELVAFARRTGMPVAGPNCMGNANFHGGVFTTFGTQFQPGDTPGGTALVTQSGNLCSTIYRICRRFGVNFSHVINTGNEAAVAFTDYLRFLADDPQTDSALCYVEGVRDGEGLLEAAQAFRRQGKLLALYKVGVSEKGAEASRSHTAALAGDRHAFEAAVRRGGAVSTTSISQLADVAYLHRFQSRQFGRRVAVLSISGAAGAILADALSAAGAELPTLPDGVQAKLLAAIPGRSMVSNPVDLTGNLTNDNQFLLEVMSETAACDQVDVLVLYLPGHFLARALPQLTALAQQTSKAVVVIDTFASNDRADVESLGVALFDDFDRAAAAIGAYGRWREAGTAPAPAAVNGLPREIWPDRSFNGRALSEIEAKRELARIGVPVALGRLAHSEDEARAAAAALSAPLVLKLVSPDIQHKSEHGFVRLGVADPEEAARVYRAMTRRAAEMAGVRVEGVSVEPQLMGGVELLCGCTRDPAFGWMMTVGLGGVFTEVMADVSCRLLPVDAAEADAMLRELKGFKLLAGYRGAPAADIGAAASAIAALSQAVLAADARVREVEINPLIVLPEGRGAYAADALVLLQTDAEGTEEAVAR